MAGREKGRRRMGKEGGGRRRRETEEEERGRRETEEGGGSGEGPRSCERRSRERVSDPHHGDLFEALPDVVRDVVDHVVERRRLLSVPERLLAPEQERLVHYLFPEEEGGGQKGMRG